MGGGIEGKFGLATSPLKLQIVEGKYGPDLGGLTDAQLREVVKVCAPGVTDKTSLLLSVVYDLSQDPTNFNPKATNLNTGRFNLRAYVGVNGNEPYMKRDLRQSRAFSRFLKERGELEEKLERHKRSYVTVLVYRQS